MTINTVDPTVSNTSSQNSKQLLSIDQLNLLNQKSTWEGVKHLGIHLTIMIVSGTIWATERNIWWLSIPALAIYGFSLASMFATVHETSHRTVFVNHGLNDIVSWWAGILSFYNSTFYRQYHKYHHRYTQIPGKDPELDDPKPSNLREYVWHISGIPWWIGKIKGHFQIAMGQTQTLYYISEEVRSQVIRSTWLQLLVYGCAIAISVTFNRPLFLLYWVLPLAVGQPILRILLLAEHTGCTEDDNYLTNTRTTLTILPIRLLMWNICFHAEHHFYPSIPFYQLPKAHSIMTSHFAHVENGYLQVHRSIVANFGQIS